MEPLDIREEIMEAARTRQVLPASTLRVIALIQESDYDVLKVCRAIGVDPVLSAQVLRVSNSVLFRPATPIVSIADAVRRLGSKNLLEAVLASIGPALPREVEGYDLERGALWEHALAVSLATKALAQTSGRALPDAAATAGLLTDIGKLLVAPYLDRLAGDVQHRALRDDLPFDRAEREVLGIDHAEAGALLLETWALPEAVVAVVRWHHDPDRCPEPYRETADLVHLAECICSMGGFGLGRDGIQYRPCEGTIDRIGYSNVTAERTLCSVFSDMEELLQSQETPAAGT